MLGYMYLSLIIVLVIFDIFKRYGFGVCPMFNGKIVNLQN